MQNLINWIEIPATNLQRAITFYSAILNLEIQEAEFFGSKMGFFPSDGTNVSGAIVQGDDYNPSKNGVLAYLNGGSNLQDIINKIEINQGIILVPKTQISPEMGYFAIFLDSEGNKMALHSAN